MDRLNVAAVTPWDIYQPSFTSRTHQDCHCKYISKAVVSLSKEDKIVNDKSETSKLVLHNCHQKFIREMIMPMKLKDFGHLSIIIKKEED